MLDKISIRLNNYFLKDFVKCLTLDPASGYCIICIDNIDCCLPGRPGPQDPIFTLLQDINRHFGPRSQAEWRQF